MKCSIAFLVCLISGNVFSLAGNSLTWQKLALEEKVQFKYNSTISALLKDNQYMVDVEVEVSEPAAPNFGNNGHKGGPRVSDLSMAEARGDYIAFSKMGLEVPVVEKFLDEDRTKLMNLYRFNETYDVFKSINSLNITVYLSDKITSDLAEIVKKVVGNTRISVSGIKPKIKFESITMEWVDPALKKIADDKKPEKKPEEQEPKIWAKDWYEWASRWGNAVGLILGALIISLIALSLFKQWKAFMEKFAAQANQPKPEEKKEEDEKEEELATAQATNIPKEEEEMAASHDFERFQQCLEQHSDEAVNMVRNWLNEDEEASLLALRGVAQQVNAADMEKLMAGLSSEQRDKWKNLIHHLEPKDLVTANKHIFQEVIRYFLVPTKIKDGELLNLIMELNSKATFEFINANKIHTGAMMNLLNPVIVGKILAEVDDDTADKWLALGAQFDIKKMDEVLPTLKEALRAHKEANGPAPFAQRIMTMIPTSSPKREGVLFRALAKAGNAGMVTEIAKRHFPSELILELPVPFLKEVLQSYPISKRVEFLQSRPEDVRANLIDILAETGTPARDMLDMELENISNDASKVQAISDRSEDIWYDFVKLSRMSLSKNSSYATILNQLIQEWSSQLQGKLQSIKGGKAA